MKRILFISLSTLSTFIHADPLDALAQMPCDVIRFTQERDICDHLRGEAPENPQVSFIEMDKYCKGTDKKLADLLRKYSNRPDVQGVLSTYDARIEPNNR